MTIQEFYIHDLLLKTPYYMVLWYMICLVLVFSAGYLQLLFKYFFYVFSYELTILKVCESFKLFYAVYITEKFQTKWTPVIKYSEIPIVMSII